MEVRVNQLRNELRRREIRLEDVDLGNAPPNTGTDTPEHRHVAELPPERQGETRVGNVQQTTIILLFAQVCTNLTNIVLLCYASSWQSHSFSGIQRFTFSERAVKFLWSVMTSIELLGLRIETIRLTLLLLMLTATTVCPKHACLQSEPLYKMPALRLACCHTFFFFLCVLTSRISRSERQSLSDDILAVLASALALSLAHFLSDAAVL